MTFEVFTARKLSNAFQISFSYQILNNQIYIFVGWRSIHVPCKHGIYQAITLAFLKEQILQDLNLTTARSASYGWTWVGGLY